MGRRSGAETPAGILLAFHRYRQWRQAELARELGVSSEALVRSIRALIDQGMPLARDDSDRPNVWWRLPKDWAPGGVLFAREQTPALQRALARLPRTRERDALLAHAARSARAGDTPPTQVESAVLTDMEQAWLSAVEDSAERRTTLGVRYLSKGRTEWRHVSVQRVLIGPPPRFVAVCHRSGTLKWFRVDSVSQARLDPDTRFRESDEAAVRAFVKESVDGYRGPGDAVAWSFVVRDPEASWVRRNLLTGMYVDPDDDVRDGIRVRSSTPGVLRSQVRRWSGGRCPCRDPRPGTGCPRTRDRSPDGSDRRHQTIARERPNRVKLPGGAR